MAGLLKNVLGLFHQPAASAEPAPDATPALLLRRAIRGSIVHSVKFGELEFVKDGLLIYDASGTILVLLDLSSTLDCLILQAEFEGIEVIDHTGHLIVPGFIDAHAHAPQHLFAGTGMDLPLLDWLETYTFPTEATFKDSAQGQRVYEQVVARHLKCGTTFASYFATIHVESSIHLAKACMRLGQRAYIGKVTMDRNSPDFYVEETEEAVVAAEEFARKVLLLSKEGRMHLDLCDYAKGSYPPVLLNERSTPLVVPAITPRFVPTCSGEVMDGLGVIAAKYSLPIQSHLSENLDEMKWVSELHPDCDTYAHVYLKHGLLGKNSYMAHCCHSPEEEMELLAKTRTGVVHCPSSNLMLCSGVADVKLMVSKGIKVGLGTDVAGGYSPSMLDAMRLCLMTSRANSLAAYQHPEASPELRVTMAESLNYKEVFHLATVGNAEVLGMGDRLGNFLKGKKLDALVINVSPESGDGPIDMYGHENLHDCFSKFIFQGDDRNMDAILVNGTYVKGRVAGMKKLTTDEILASERVRDLLMVKVHKQDEMDVSTRTVDTNVTASMSFASLSSLSVFGVEDSAGSAEDEE